MPNCRVELFVTEPDYDPVWNIGEMGHIHASSDGGPRPNPAMRLDNRDEYANLILLCRNCHSRIDGLAEKYPPDRLREIKASHEAWVRTALPERGFSSISWNVLLLKGDFAVDMSTVSAALSPDQSATEIEIVASPSQDKWQQIKSSLEVQTEALLSRLDPISTRIAVFPLAPVSACLFLGYLLTNRLNVRAFQYHRDDHSWTWPNTSSPLEMPTVSELVEGVPETTEVFFLFQLSAFVDASILRAAVGGDQSVYACSVSNPSTGWLRAKSQLDELARKSREMFEVASMQYPSAKRWHICYAGPAPGAIVVGQQLNPTMTPLTQLYEFQRPSHLPSFSIDFLDSPLTRWNPGPE